MTDFKTKPLVLVTGVGPGTGTAAVRGFAEGGHRVAMLARDADRLIALEREIGAPAYAADGTAVFLIASTNSGFLTHRSGRRGRVSRHSRRLVSFRAPQPAGASQ